MITAVDTNVVVDVLVADARFGQTSLRLLQTAQLQGRLVACDVVWAELAAFVSDTARLRVITATLQLQFEPSSAEAAEVAGSLHKRYRESGGKRERLVADFLVAGHALTHADRLLTRDRGFYGKHIARLKLMKA